MKVLLGLVLVCSTSTAMAATASEELKKVIQCHEALDGKSSGNTEKLSYESATPFALPATKKIYFVTDKSIYSIEDKFQGKDLLIHLIDKDKDFYRKMAITSSGKIGSISYDEIKDKKDAQEPKAQLDDEILGLFKKDLVRRVSSMMGEYQNKYDPQDTLNAINICNEIKSPEMQKAVEKQTAFYEKLLKKPRAYSDGLKSKKAAGKQ